MTDSATEVGPTLDFPFVGVIGTHRYRVDAARRLWDHWTETHT